MFKRTYPHFYVRIHICVLCVILLYIYMYVCISTNERTKYVYKGLLYVLQI